MGSPAADQSSLPPSYWGHVGEPERFQTPRRPRAEIARGIGAVDDDRSPRIEDRGGLRIDPSERQTHRSAYVLGFELIGGEHLDELSSSLDQSPDLLAIDDPGHPSTFGQ